MKLTCRSWSIYWEMLAYQSEVNDIAVLASKREYDMLTKNKNNKQK